jgi:hypothetical protein
MIPTGWIKRAVTACSSSSFLQIALDQPSMDKDDPTPGVPGCFNGAPAFPALPKREQFGTVRFGT